MNVMNSYTNQSVDLFDYGGGMALQTGVLLSTWLAGATALVNTWYDQTGNGFHAIGVGSSRPVVNYLTPTETTVYFPSQTGVLNVLNNVSTNAVWVTYTALSNGNYGVTTLFGDAYRDVSLRLWWGNYPNNITGGVYPNNLTLNTPSSDWLYGDSQSLIVSGGYVAETTMLPYQSQNTLVASSQTTMMARSIQVKS